MSLLRIQSLFGCAGPIAVPPPEKEPLAVAPPKEEPLAVPPPLELKKISVERPQEPSFFTQLSELAGSIYDLFMSMFRVNIHPRPSAPPATPYAVKEQTNPTPSAPPAEESVALPSAPPAIEEEDAPFAYPIPSAPVAPLPIHMRHTRSPLEALEGEATPISLTFNERFQLTRIEGLPEDLHAHALHDPEEYEEELQYRRAFASLAFRYALDTMYMRTLEEQIDGLTELFDLMETHFDTSGRSLNMIDAKDHVKRYFVRAILDLMQSGDIQASQENIALLEPVLRSGHCGDYLDFMRDFDPETPARLTAYGIKKILTMHAKSPSRDDLVSLVQDLIAGDGALTEEETSFLRKTSLHATDYERSKAMKSLTGTPHLDLGFQRLNEERDRANSPTAKRIFEIAIHLLAHKLP